MLTLAVILSGAASLAYQVAWTRRVIDVTSATATAQGFVLAIFMAGLGLGAYVAGRRSRGLRRPLWAYAAVEVLAAVLALGSLPLLDASDGVRAALSGPWGPSAALSGQLLVLGLYLLVPSALMGAALPFVLEHVLRRAPARGGGLVSLLYGANTLGAVAGTLVAGFVTVEALGLSATVRVGAGLAAAAAVLAGVQGRSERRPSVDASPTASRGPGPILVLAAGAAGFVGLAAETIWTRLVSLVVLTTVYAFSQVLAAVLLGVVVGAVGSGIVLARGASEDRAVSAAALGLALGAVTTGLGPHLVTWLAADPGFEHALARGFSLGGAAFLLVLVVPAAACTAASLPLLVAAARHLSGADAFGRLYAANTLGSVAGGIGASFVLLPGLGTAGALLAVELVALGTALLLATRARRRRPIVRVAALGLVTTWVLFFGQDVPRAVYARRLPEGARILDFVEGTHSDVMVTESARGRRRLWINSAWVAGTGGGHRLLGHLPALFVDRPRAAAGIALGTGQTFAAALRHGFEDLRCVEIDPGVVRLSKRYFSRANGGLFDDPRVHLHNDDGRAFLRTTERRFDLIVLEPLQAWSSGTSSLYSVDFYRDARRALAPGGVVAQWIPFYGQDVRLTQVMVRAGLEVFPEASLWLDENDGILLLHDGGLRLEPEALAHRIRARDLEGALARNHVAEVRDLLALFLAGPEGLRAWTARVPLLTDDHPFLEFGAARQVGRAFRGPILASIAEHLEPPSAYVVGTSTAAAEEALAVRTAVLRASTSPPAEALRWLERGLRAVPQDALLLHRYEEAALRAAEARPRSAAAIYARALELAPTLGRVAVNLAILHRRAGRPEVARALLRQASEDPEAAAIARRLSAEWTASSSTAVRAEGRR